MKLINIEIRQYKIVDDWEIRVLFWKWIIASFRVEVLTNKIIRIK